MHIDLVSGERIVPCLPVPCLAYDEPFVSAPVWVRYETESRRLSVVCEDGQACPVDSSVDASVAQRLQRTRRIMLVHVREGRPVEGVECRLRRFDNSGNELACA